MTLGFTTHFPDGQLTRFEQKILWPYERQVQFYYPDLLPKIHSFRIGNRWRAGMKIHMVTGNRTRQRGQFNLDYPQLQVCTGTQECVIRTVNIPMKGFSVEIDGREVSDLLFMVNDGFDGPDRFFEWFGHLFKSTEHVGQIVHWTDFKY